MEANSPESSNPLAQRRRPRRSRRGLIIGGIVILVLVIGRLLNASFSVPTGSMANTILPGDAILVSRMSQDARRGKIIVFKFPGHRNQVQADEEQYYLNRCIALPGEVLEVREKKVFVDGAEQPLPLQGIPSSGTPMTNDHLRTFPEGAGYTRDNWGPMRIPKKGDAIPLNDSTFYFWYIFIGREGHQVERSGETIKVDGRPVTQYVVERDYCFGMGDNRDNALDSRYWGFIPVDDIVGKPWLVYWSQDPDGDEGVRWDRIFKSVE